MVLIGVLSIITVSEMQNTELVAVHAERFQEVAEDSKILYSEFKIVDERQIAVLATLESTQVVANEVHNLVLDHKKQLLEICKRLRTLEQLTSDIPIAPCE